MEKKTQRQLAIVRNPPHNGQSLFMPEHAYVKGASSNFTLRVAPSSAAQPICDTRSQADQCCQISQGCGLQQSSTQCSTAGNCTPDTQGGCQGSTPGLPSSCCSPTCPDLAQGTLLQSIATSGVPLIDARPVLKNPVVRMTVVRTSPAARMDIV
jgi:hypothetical protein